jgi:dolichol-phosphate mannosyltransferase
MPDREDVCVLIPAFEEAATIGAVVAAFRERGFPNVLVVDGHSTDGTREVAAEHGARVIEQSGTGRGGGKGQAVREGVASADAPYVLMLDGDGTYDPADADALLSPLLSGEAEHVIGNRFADMDPGAMTRLNRVGNRLINRAFAAVHGRDLVDILSGYRAFTRESFLRCNPSRDDFGIETELAVECVKRAITTAVVPTSYRARPDGSETSLRPVRDGGRILVALYRLAKTNNPLFYFGSVGTVSTLVGALVAAYVLAEWLTVGVSHEVLAVAAAAAVLFGVQLLMFGVLSDMIVTINREQTRRLERLAGRSGRPSVERTPDRPGRWPGVPGPAPEDPVDGGERGGRDATEDRPADRGDRSEEHEAVDPAGRATAGDPD